MKRIASITLPYIKLFFYLQIGFWVFSLLSVLLPNEPIKRHLEEALVTYDGEPLYPAYFIRAEGHELDNYTDYLIMDFMYNVSPHKPMKYVAFPQGHLVEQTGDGQLQLKNTVASQGIETNFIYGRYWVGTSYFLRWLFLFAGLSGVRWMFFLIGSLALMGFISSLGKSIGNFQLSLFVLGLVFVNYYLFFMSFQFAPVFIITFLGAIVLNRRLKMKQKVGTLFLILGALTSYFDLLTFPIITLGIPLLLWISSQNDEINLKDAITKLFCFSLIWTFGYLGSWTFKWLIVTAFADYSLVNEAFNQINIRTGLYDLSRWGAIKANLTLIKWKYFYVIVAFMLALLLLSFKKQGLKKAFLFLSVSILPFLWEFVTANHVDMHNWFTYRNFWITITGILLALGALIKKEKFKELRFFLNLNKK